MLKVLVVLVPMVVGAALAGTVRAATPLDIRTDSASAVTVQASLADMPVGGLRSLQAPAAVVTPFTAAVATRDSSGLPEPAAWAIMLAGFGVVGAAARHRRAHRLA